MQETAPPTPHPEPPTQNPAPAEPMHDYPSDPLAIVKQAWAQFWPNAKSSLAGMTAIQVGLLIAVLICAGISVLAVLGAVFFALAQSGNPTVRGTFNGLLSQLPPNVASSATALGAVSGVAIALATVTGVVAVLVGSLAQAVYFAYGHAVLRASQDSRIKQAMRLGLKRTGPLFIQSLLMLAVPVTLLVLPIVLLVQIGGGVLLILPIYIFMLIVALLIVALRLAFAPLALVLSNLGPIQSIKYSWRLTKGRLWEILGLVGLLSIISSVLTLPGLLLEAALPTADAAINIIGVVQFIAMTAVTVVSMAVVVYFFDRVRHTAENNIPHKANYGINIAWLAAALVVGIIMGNIENATRPASPFMQDTRFNDSFYNYEAAREPSDSDGLNNYPVDPNGSDDPLYQYQ